MENQNIIIQTEFQGIILNIRHHEKYEWLLNNEEVAKGYGVDSSNIRFHKRKKDFLNQKHFITVSNTHGGEPTTYWTKRGVARLGFFIKSERAIAFRDWAEDLIINHLEPKNNNLESVKNELEAKFLQQQSELKQELKNELHKTQTELIHTLKQDLLEATQNFINNKVAQNNKQLFWQFWEYLNLVQGKLEERIEKLEPPKMEDLEEESVFIYAMQQNKTTKHKLGWSATPKTRKQNIISNSGEDMEIVVLIKMPSVEIAKALEDFLKGIFKAKHIKGEWYHLEKNDIKMLKMMAEMFEMYKTKNP